MREIENDFFRFTLNKKKITKDSKRITKDSPNNIYWLLVFINKGIINQRYGNVAKEERKPVKNKRLLDIFVLSSLQKHLISTYKVSTSINDVKASEIKNSYSYNMLNSFRQIIGNVQI